MISLKCWLTSICKAKYSVTEIGLHCVRQQLLRYIKSFSFIAKPCTDSTITGCTVTEAGLGVCLLSQERQTNETDRQKTHMLSGHKHWRRIKEEWICGLDQQVHYFRAHNLIGWAASASIQRWIEKIQNSLSLPLSLSLFLSLSLSLSHTHTPCCKHLTYYTTLYSTASPFSLLLMALYC